MHSLQIDFPASLLRKDRANCVRCTFHHVPPVLSLPQHSFINIRSCSSIISTYLTLARDAMLDGEQTGAVSCYYSVVFQSVNHTPLIHKLKKSVRCHNEVFRPLLPDRHDRESS